MMQCIIRNKRLAGCLLVFACLVWNYSHQQATQVLRKPEKELDYKTYSKLFNKCQCNIKSLNLKYKSVKVREETYKVPRRLHFLWIRTKIQDKYVEKIRKYVADNPDYKVTLWTDQTSMKALKGNKTAFRVRNVYKELRSFKRQDVIKAEQSLVCQANIMRHEILYKYGGIYSDIDSWSIGPFGHEFRHSFVAMDGVKQNCVMDDGYIKKCMMDGYIQNRIMGFPRHSNFTAYILSTILESYQIFSLFKSMFNVPSVPAQYGTVFFSTAFLQYNDPEIRIFQKEIVVEASTVSEDKKEKDEYEEEAEDDFYDD